MAGTPLTTCNTTCSSAELGPAGLAAAHARLLDGYRIRYPSGWAALGRRPLPGRYSGRSSARRRPRPRTAGFAHRCGVDPGPSGWRSAARACFPITATPLIRSPARSCGPCGCPHRSWPPTLGRSAVSSRADCWAILTLLSRTGPRGLTRRSGPGPWLVPLGPALTPTTTALEQVLTGHDGWVRAVAVTADGARAVSGGVDGTVRVWDLATGRQQAELTGHDGHGVGGGGHRGRAPGRSAAAATGRCGCGTWPPAASRPSSPATTGTVWAVAVTADGRPAVTGGDDGTVRVWDLATGRQPADAHRPRRPGAGGGGHRGRAPGRSPAATTGRCGCGTWPPAASRPAHRPRRPGAAVAVTADGARRSPAARTGRCGCGTWPPAASRPAHRPRRPGAGGGGHRGRHPGGHRRRATGRCGCGTWPPAASGAELTGHDGQVCGGGGHRGRRPGRSPAAATGRCGCGTWPPAASGPSSPATTARCRGGGHRGRAPARSPAAATATVRVWDLATGRRAGARSPATTAGCWRWRSRADGGPAVTGGERRHGAGVGPGHRPPAGDRSPATTARCCAVAVTADGGPGGHRRPRRDGAGVGPGHRPRSRPAHRPRRPGVRRWRSPRTGARAVTGGDDGTVRVWDLAAGRAAGRAHRPRRPGAGGGGHRGRPPGRSPAASDGTVRVWDLATGRAAGPAHRPRRPGAGGGGHRGRRPGGHRRRGRDGAGVGPGHRNTRSPAGTGDYPVIGCTALPGRPLKIGVGQQRGQPYLLELRGERTTQQSDRVT